MELNIFSYRSLIPIVLHFWKDEYNRWVKNSKKDNLIPDAGPTLGRKLNSLEKVNFPGCRIRIKHRKIYILEAYLWQELRPRCRGLGQPQWAGTARRTQELRHRVRFSPHSLQEAGKSWAEHRRAWCREVGCTWSRKYTSSGGELQRRLPERPHLCSTYKWRLGATRGFSPRPTPRGASRSLTQNGPLKLSYWLYLKCNTKSQAP